MKSKVEYTSRFERSLKRKRRLHLAERVEETVVRVLIDPDSNALRVHKIKGTDTVWEAYVDKANRVTLERDGDTVVFRNNCRHDIIDQDKW